MKNCEKVKIYLSIISVVVDFLIIIIYEFPVVLVKFQKQLQQLPSKKSILV